VVQKISIDPLYLKPAAPLGRFCPEANNLFTIVTWLPSVNNLVAMVHKQSKPTWLPLLSMVNNLVARVVMEHKQSTIVKQGSPHNF
jgi:hypothetical protein